VLRALTAAQGYLQGDFPTIEIAAQSCGSGVVYVAAAVVVLSSEDLALKDRVLSGQVSLRNAAASAKRQAAIVAAYRASSTADHAAAFKILGPECVLEELVVADEPELPLF